jgi:hypothetical protein
LNSPGGQVFDKSTLHQRRSFLARIPFHPFLIAAAPALMLVGGNLGQVRLGSTWRALFVSVAAAVLFFLLFQFLFRDWHRAALAASFLVLLGLSYGHLYRALRNLPMLDAHHVRHRYLIPILVLVTTIMLSWLARARELSLRISEFANAAALVMIIVPLIQILSYEFRAYTSSQDQSKQTPPALVSRLDGEYRFVLEGEPPDIYYIILDGYGRADILQEYFDLDNEAFLQELSERGFYIAECSRSNYTLTALSMPSALNFSHLDEFGIELNKSDMYEIGRYAKGNLLRRILEDLGYKMVAFESGYFVTEWADADLYLSYESAFSDPLSGVNAFEAMFLDSTIAKVPLDFRHLLPQSWGPILDYAYTAHRERVLYTLEHLENMPRIELGGPKFVMAHILAPHPPFVFGPNGEFISQRETFTLKEDILYTDREDYTSGYRDQLQFINKKVLELVEQLQSANSSIIILQGDHGPSPGMTSRFGRTAILNAYYLPGVNHDALYPAITPVNSFRVVLNEYFGANFPLAEDEARFSSYGEPLSFTIVEEENPTCTGASTR